MDRPKTTRVRKYLTETRLITDDQVQLSDIDNDPLFSYNSDISRVDVEIFIHKLGYREMVVLLFRSIDTPVEEIGDILGLHASNIYKIINELRRKCNNEI